MEKSILNYEQFKDFPVVQAFTRRHLFVVFNGEGRILEFHDTSRFQYHLFLKELEETRDLHRFFEFTGAGDLPETGDTSVIFNATKNFSLRENLIEFYTSLAASILRVMRVGKDRYLGVISIAPFLPNVFPLGKNSLVFIDSEDRLKGFNPHFFQLFHSRYASPADMLDQPVDRFFSPTPSEIQRQRLPDFKPGELAGFTSVLDVDCRTKRGPEAFQPFGEMEGLWTAEGFSWKSRDPLLSYLILPPRLDTRQKDFFISWEAEALEGEPPVVMLSNRVQEVPEKLQQYNVLSGGYLAGMHGVLPRTCVIKRAGVILKSENSAAPRARRQMLVKKGNALFYFQEGKQVLAYYEMDFFHPADASLALALRDGAHCRLQRLQVGFREVSQAGKESGDNIIVKLKDAPGSHFALNGFSNQELTASYPDVSGYYLQNITDLQDKLSRITAQYREELKKRERLEILNRESKGERRDFFGVSAKISAIKETARVAAASQATVLIEGPTGSGKEVLARFIHAHSTFKEGPFIKVDCSTLPRELMESELFGHEKGAFTGAVERKTGRFEMASGGTLFLDEVANLTLEAQAKLLQFLQDFTVQRVGGSAPLKLNLRVVAASNVPLTTLVGSGAFREDLYFRICVVIFKLPPLAERRDDLLELVNHFLDIFNEAEKKRISRISEGTLRKIYGYAWPGNIRELKNVIHRAVLFCGENEIREEHLVLGQAPAEAGDGEKTAPRYHRLSALSEEEIRAVLGKHRGILRRAAKELGVTQRGLYYFLQRKKWDPARFRGRPKT